MKEKSPLELAIEQRKAVIKALEEGDLETGLAYMFQRTKEKSYNHTK